MNVICRAATSNPGAALLLSNFNLFSNFQSIVHFNSEVTHRAFQFCVPEEQLHSPQVFGVAINYRYLGPAHRVRSVVCGIKPDLANPTVHKHLALGPLLDEHYDSQGRNDYSVILPHHTRLTASRLWLVIMKGCFMATIMAR